MSIKTDCPNCGHVYLLADDQAGRTVRCRQCQKTFPVTNGRQVDEAVSAAPRAAAAAPRRRPARPTRPAPSGKGVLGLILFLVGSAAVVLLFLGLAGGGLYVWFRILNVEAESHKPIATDTNVVAAGLPPVQGGNPAEPPADLADDPTVGDPADLPAANADPANPLGVKVENAPPAAGDDAQAGNSELAADVLRRVKRSTLYLRVTLPDGEVAQGSGFFAALPGLIVTNAHVVGMLQPGSKKPKEIEATENGGRADEKKFKAVILGVDRRSDLALLRPKTDGVPVVPPSLDVHSARELRETQKVFIFGFPFGEQLGKSVTVSESSVSSIREDSGVLRRVQVNGGMHPGNSGGPVVDAKGNVVGVSVAVIRNSQINFAVPGDNIRSLVSGRPAQHAVVDQPHYTKGEAIAAPVTFRLLDPLNRVRSAGVEVWTGSAGEGKPAGDKQQAARPGDSTHERLELRYAKGVSQGEVPLPKLPAGKVYWLQPTWTDAAGQAHWDAPVACPLKSPPVHQEPASLVHHHAEGNHAIKLNTRNIWKYHGTESDPEVVVTMATPIQEDVVKTTADGSELQLKYGNPDFNFTVNGRHENVPEGLRDAVGQVGRLAVRLRLNGQGDLATAPQLDLNQASLNSRSELTKLGQEMQQSLDLLAVPLPNREVKVGEQWKTRRDLPIDAPGLYEMGTAWLTYTYLGKRQRDGHEEAVVGVSGVVRGARQAHVSGQVHGTAVIDLEAGRVSQGDVTVSTDLETNMRGNPVEASGTLQVSMQRTLR